MRLPGSTSTTATAQSCFDRLIRSAAAATIVKKPGLPFRDESIIAVSVGAGGELQANDTRLQLRSSSYCYTKEQLLIIKKSPLSSRIPACLDPAHNNSDGKWDPEVYVSYCKLQESTCSRGGKVKNRRSLDSGCSISPIRKSELVPFFESNRRSGGSSRIAMDSFQEKHFEFDTRSYQDMTMERTFSSEDTEEPEWFSSGPTSKHDMIELRGFEDIEEEKEDSPAVKPAPEDEKTEKKAGPKGRSTPTSMDESARNSPKKLAELQDNSAAKKSGGGFKFDEFFRIERWDAPTNATNAEAHSSKRKHPNGLTGQDKTNFNFDEFFKSDCWSVSSMPTVSSNDRSRFSQWFTSHDTSHNSDSALSKSFEERYLSNLLNISDSSDSGRKHHHQHHQQQQQKRDPESAKLLEMLHQNDHPPQSSYDVNSFFEMVKKSSLHNRGPSGHVMSLQEVEARMQQGAAPQPKSKKDILAFRKLLSQASSGQAQAAAPAPPPVHAGLNSRKVQFPPAPQMPEQAINPMAFIQVMDFVRNFWNVGQQNAPIARPVVNPYFNNNNCGFVGQPLKKNYGNDRRSPSKLLHKDSTLYHRRVRLNENN